MVVECTQTSAPGGSSAGIYPTFDHRSRRNMGLYRSSRKNIIMVDFLAPENKRMVLLPIRYPSLFNIFKKQQEVIWKTEEIDFQQRDVDDWNKLSDDAQNFLLHILGFFASSDMLIVDNLLDNFMSEVQIAECRAFYALQGYIESIHSETYATMLSMFAPKDHDMFDALNRVESIRMKGEWAKKYMDESKPFAHRLWAFCIFEGVLFAASFASIFWLKKQGGKCPGLIQSNELIARDEALHALFGIEMLNMTKDPISEEDAHTIMEEAIRCEKEFVDEALPERLMGLNADSLKRYVQFCADKLLTMAGFQKLYKTTNPYEWMTSISLEGKTNFFEKRVTEYSAADKSHEFGIDDDF